ncbi:unnamed protein product [Brachionus calyciflorus]|uniref:G-protein coupled receptors family 1 profile domain-containing protein n=1 Tax=Brachionus calyciflorus TaxID=104777 RepID=A0A813UBH3_9BILA|nr:unnamed protein product [Brachionus calyciflorus]
MVENTIGKSNIFLTILCCIILVCSFIFNFTLLVTLLKLRRLNRIDKSNYLLTHLIFVDFLSSFFILVPSGYAVYNSNSLDFNGCRIQTFFTTFFLSMTFHGLFVLTVERFIKYQFPIWHINNFTKRLKYDENDKLLTKSTGNKVFFIILIIWILNIFISFIPFFVNYSDIQYFTNQTQCDYIYEKFNWWLWLFFWLSLTVPFLGGLFFSFLTLRIIYVSDRRIKLQKRSEEFENRHFTNGKMVERIIEGIDITRQPANRIYYEHLVNPDEEESLNNDFHVRNQLLSQFKYQTDKSKTITFLVILVLSYCLVFPIFVIHFYRTYNPSGGAYDDETVVQRSTYTAFAWISYLALIIKSFVCLVQNRFYRHALYQSANCRGFSGVFDFQQELKNLAVKIDSIGQKEEKI